MPSLRPFLSACLSLLLFAPARLPAAAQAVAPKPIAQGKAAPAPRQQKPPALIDPAGPAVSLESSEALFDIAVALNACGYDAGLAQSDPVRQQVRDADGRALRQLVEACTTR